MLQLETDVQLH